MKEFEFFTKNLSVKKQSPDMNLARATAKDSEERLAFAKSIMHTQKPKYVLENAYEALRGYIDAILFSEGYKSYSHEASISYLLKLGLSIGEVAAADRLRWQRNGIKYYGENVSEEDAKEALAKAGQILNKLKKMKKI